MALKILAGLVAAVLVLLFVAPVVLKLKEISLGAVVLIGVVMMLVDLWQSIVKKEE